MPGDGPGSRAARQRLADPGVRAARQKKKDAQYFPTPEDVAGELLALAMISYGDRVLEPSAGTGVLAAVIAAVDGVTVDCIEREPGYAAEITAAGFARAVTVTDFLAMPPDPVYDKVIMNPPFARSAWAAHVLHAAQFVRPGGRLVFIAPAAVQDAARGPAGDVRRDVASSGGWIEALPAGAFRDSGTLTPAAAGVIPVPELSRPPGDGTRLVTIDATASGDHFDPCTAAPGAYAYTGSLSGEGPVPFRDAGACTGCGALTWARDDGGHAVRGPFGPRTRTLMAVSVTGPDGTGHEGEFPVCGGCAHGGNPVLRETAISNARAALMLRAGTSVPVTAPQPRHRPRTGSRRGPRRSPPDAPVLF
jgi:protein-L-isoaspartate O-methyltransferase